MLSSVKTEEKITSYSIRLLGPLGQKVAKNAFSWHPFGEHLVCGLFERHIGILPLKKVPKRKTCQILRKQVICDYLLLNCITAKRFKILHSTITKTTCIMRKSTKTTYETFKQVFYFSNSFRVTRCQTPICGSIFTFKTKITQKLFEE